MRESLSPADRERLERLFERAADLPPAEQATFLEKECAGNEPLRAELAWLLAGLAGKDRLDPMQQALPARVGTRIGPYHLLEKIGEGGMGEVYAAEQSEPVTRRVALKVIKPGMDSAQVIARFEAERQALARMAHPNIAQVFDAGATKEGLPFFVMELVAGVPITEYCDGQKLVTRERLELFLAICGGVQHAHQKGIIHRDLKPSNLLVMRQDGRAVPKIIDFGVARATSGRLTERTLHTVLGQIVGTLDYMSPEQADPTALEIDTRTDIYSLGVVLYQLVSGFLPFDHATSAGLQLAEVQRTIREVDPPTPSQRLRRQTGTATRIARLHGTDERKLVHQLAGDLDWICLKALEKDPARRYASASELAEDVRRHLAHEPVLAGRPGALYRARKFVRRNRLAVVAGLLVTGAGLVGLFGVVWGRIEAKTSARLADALRPLANTSVLRHLEAEADELWPAEPSQVPSLGEWLDRARALPPLLSGYRAELEELRTRALAWTTDEQEKDRATHPRADELASKEAELADWIREIESGLSDEQLEEADERLLVLEPAIAALEPEVRSRRTWSFDSAFDAGWHEVLRVLVDGLEAMVDAETGLLGPEAASAEHGWSVPRRLAFARTVEERSLSGADARARWAAAIDSIADPSECPAYDGLRITPQIGLLPIGRDPSSRLWEFAHLQTGAPAERGADGKLTLSETTGLVFVLLPAGTFDMGAQGEDRSLPNYDPDARRGNREGPPMRVSLPAFFLSKFEMTQAQWTCTAGTNPSLYQKFMVKPAPRNPVNRVSWTECSTWMQRLALELPSEEQWEYAARAGTSTVRWWGDDAASISEAANTVGNADGFLAIAPVGSFPANPFGLHDMLGNVSEWCSNHPYEYGTLPGTAPETLTMRAARGGSSRAPPIGARSAFRLPLLLTSADPSLGLRPARILDAE